MLINFRNISIRGRVAYGICCLENAIRHYNLEHLDWSFILELLWSYTDQNIGRWHEFMSECSADSILEELEFEKKGIRNISFFEYQKLRDLYLKSNPIINQIINTIVDIGTYDLYASIVNNSPKTIEYIDELIVLMDQNNILLPDIIFFQKFTINENEGWGCPFVKKDIFC
jgi:hypothetical protein